MDLELSRTHFNCYDMVLDTTIMQEETMETIVPDACPDILQIVDTQAKVFLQSKEAQDGRCEVGGTVKVSVLYLPEEEVGLRHISLSIPFLCRSDLPSVTAQCKLLAIPRVQGAETRILNPRKVLTRVNLAVALRVYTPQTAVFCQGVAQGDDGVQQLCTKQSVSLVTALQEKPFHFTDEVSIPGSRPGAEELLHSRVELTCSESKIIGSKLIFKGEAVLQLLYRAAEGVVCTFSFELPFSQIMEIPGVDEDAACTLELTTTDLDCVLTGEGGGRTAAVSMELLAQASVRESRSIELLSDLYSISCNLKPTFQVYSLQDLLDASISHQTVREVLESELPVKSVIDSHVELGGLHTGREGDLTTFTVDAAVTVLCLTEEDHISAMRQSFPITCKIPLPEGCLCSCTCTTSAERFATPTAGGIEVRFSLDFRYVALSTRQVAGVVDVQAEEGGLRDTTHQPSIVLRMLGEQEGLWDIAKSYSTTTEDIMRANELTEETIEPGRLLLIPKRRG